MPISAACLTPFIQRPISEWATTSFHVTDSVGGTNIDYRIVDSSGNGTSWQPWSNIGSAPAGSRSIGQNLPTGGPWFVQIRDHNNQTNVVTSSDSFLVGDIRAYLGQSNAQNMWVSSSASPPTPSQATKLYVNGSWATPTGDGCISLLNDLYAATGVPQAILGCAIGGTPLTLDGVITSRNNNSNPTDWWLWANDEGPQSGTYGQAWYGFMSALNATGGKLAGIIWDGCENDCAGVKRDVILKSYSQLWGNIQTLITDRRAPSIRMAMVQFFLDSSALPGFSQTEVVAGQAKFVSKDQSSYIAAARDDLTRLADDLHYTPSSYAILGSRIASGVTAEEYNF